MGAAAPAPILLVMGSSMTSILAYAIVLPLLPGLLDADTLGPVVYGSVSGQFMSVNCPQVPDIWTARH